MYRWNWNVIFQYKYIFLQGAITTLKLALLVVILGTVLGILIGMVRRSSVPFLPAIAKVYIVVFRAIPTLILLVWFYYVAPIIFNVQFSPFITAVIAMSISLSAFVAETFRAAVESIPKNQFESGITLGLSQTQTMLYIILPQAAKNMLPNLLGLYVTELKNTSLASVIAVDEILHKSSAISSVTYRPLEIYTTVAIAYLVIVIPFSLLAGWTEKRMNRESQSSRRELSIAKFAGQRSKKASAS